MYAAFVKKPAKARDDGARQKCYRAGVKLEGDEEGITVLKAMAEKDKEYLKMLVAEARTNTDLKATFRSEDGRLFVLRVELKSGNLVVEPG